MKGKGQEQHVHIDHLDNLLLYFDIKELHFLKHGAFSFSILLLRHPDFALSIGVLPCKLLVKQRMCIEEQWVIKLDMGGQDVLAFKSGLSAGGWGEVEEVESKDLT